MEIKGWKEYLPLLVAAISAVFVAFRLLSVAGFNSETAYAILQANGTGTVIVGSLLTIVTPAFVTAATASGLILIATRHEIREKNTDDRAHLRRTRFRWIMITIYGGIISLAFTPVFFVVAIPVTLALFFGLALVTRTRHGRPDSKLLVRRILLGAAGILTLSAIIPTPWLPVELISIQGSRPVVGYVLAAADNDISILTASQVRVEHIDPKKIIRRRLCTLSGSDLTTKSLIALALPLSYPKC